VRISAPSGYRHGDNDIWDHCVLCGDRWWPGAELGEYEGRKYCHRHLAAKLANVIDVSSWELTEERGAEYDAPATDLTTLCSPVAVYDACLYDGIYVYD
jgi:hypothetical protein